MTDYLAHVWLETERQWRNRQILVFRLGIPTAIYLILVAVQDTPERSGGFPGATGRMVALAVLADLPRWLASIGRLLPVSHPAEALRRLLVDGHGLAFTGDGRLLPMIGVAAAWSAAGALIFHLGDRRARRDVTLRY